MLMKDATLVGGIFFRISWLSFSIGDRSLQKSFFLLIKRKNKSVRMFVFMVK